MGGLKIKERNRIYIISDNEGYASEHILQLVTKARMLADSYDMTVSVVCIGEADEKAFEKLKEYGADIILFCVQQKTLGIRDYSDIVADILRHKAPRVVLYPASSFGKQLAAILSTRFEAGLTADCTDIQFDEEDGFLFYRAAINDSVIAKIKGIHCQCTMCTVKKNVFIKRPYSALAAGVIENHVFSLQEQQIQSQLEFFNIVKAEERAAIDINKYSVVFCIGRGVKEEKVRKRIFSLAESCHAGVAGTRAVVEDNLIDKDRQVGQSGKSISPRLYIGFGVSGASQHLVGIRNADMVIAINNDENAAIFNYADYSIVEDVEVIVEEMERLLYRDMAGKKTIEKQLQMSSQ